MNRKKILVICFLFPIVIFGQTRDIGGFGELIDDVVAIVNDDVILRSELLRQVNTFKQNPAIVANFSDAEIQSEIIEQMISQKVQIQRANQLGVFITDDEVNLALNTIAEQNGVELSQIPQLLQASGINYTAYRADLEEELTIQQLLLRDVAPRILILPLELESCMNLRLETLNSAIEYNVSHILLNSSSLRMSDDDLETLAEEILNMLDAGESFDNLAAEYSSALTSNEGGLIGWRNGNQLPSVFSSEALALDIGEISDPIAANNTVHIVKLNDRRGGQTNMVPQKLISHILITPTEVDDDLIVEQRLNDIRDRALMGEDFGVIASAISDDAMSGAELGSLGWVSPGYLVPEFEAQVSSVDEGEITLPFQTRFGWHIAQVIDNRTHDATNEVIELECDEQIRDQKFEEQRLRWATQLRDQAYVEILL